MSEKLRPWEIRQKQKNIGAFGEQYTIDRDILKEVNGAQSKSISSMSIDQQLALMIRRRKKISKAKKRITSDFD